MLFLTFPFGSQVKGLFNQQFGGRGIGRFTEPRRSRRAAPSREGKLKE
ncbi:TPA: hypothetical protein ACTCZD_001955 [Neisseria meningitidis]|nr:hypothetical protein [Neisseria meningitidis]